MVFNQEKPASQATPCDLFSDDICALMCHNWNSDGDCDQKTVHTMVVFQPSYLLCDAHASLPSRSKLFCRHEAAPSRKVPATLSVCTLP